jgi:DNA repair protein RadC
MATFIPQNTTTPDKIQGLGEFGEKEKRKNDCSQLKKNTSKSFFSAKKAAENFFFREYKGMNTMNFDYKKTKCDDIRYLTLANGIAYPSDEELIAMILDDDSDEILTEKIAETVRISSPENLVQNLLKIDGISEKNSLLLAASLELGRRKFNLSKIFVRSPRDIIPFLKHYSRLPTEHFVTVTLNGAREIISEKVISVGTINKAMIHPREIFAGAVAEYASGLICCHNHPCGRCFPSDSDIDSTRILQKAAEILGISFLDHIIITEDEYFSFLENGLLQKNDG